MEEEESGSELQLLLLPKPSIEFPNNKPVPEAKTDDDATDHPQLDLSLSISVGQKPQPQPQPPPPPPPLHEKPRIGERSVQALRQQTAEQIRLASAEKAYAERVRELTRRELELAEKEFARARAVWERAREEVERVERMKEMSTRRVGPACLEITCHSCRQRFCP
uniref:Protein indeterminate-domain 16 n=1 Tax=Ananas comosus var. bracteatus TaxID=296719 RepID=A0A6V7NNM7_ANACO|nr:unnamed protein product [Ananas comosus var. bracteatus]